MAEQSCVFCDIILERVPANIVYQDANVVAFRDISPAAPTHVLVAPREHIVSLADVTDLQWPLIGATLHIVQRVARDLGLAESGYRLIANIGPDSGQQIPHLHWHILGGRPLGPLLNERSA